MSTPTAILTQTPIRTAPATWAGGDATARRLRDLHARAGQLVADTRWSPDVERAVHDLAVEIRRTVAELSGTETFVPSLPGSGIPAIVRYRELGVLQRRLVQVLRGAVDHEPVHQATVRTSALVGALAGTVA